MWTGDPHNPIAIRQIMQQFSTGQVIINFYLNRLSSSGFLLETQNDFFLVEMPEISYRFAMTVNLSHTPLEHDRIT